LISLQMGIMNLNHVFFDTRISRTISDCYVLNSNKAHARLFLAPETILTKKNEQNNA